MKYQFILRHFILWAAWCFLLMGIAGAQPQSTGQSQAKAINHVPDPLEGLEEPWKTMPISELLKAAESGNAHAQYAYWIREFLLAWEEPDRLSAVVSSNVYRLPFKEQMKLVDEQNRTRGKWEAATEAELQQAAQSGDNMAMQFLAIRKAGQAVQRSTNAFAWLEKSAEQGFPAAEFEASMYYLGQSGRNIIKINQEKGMGLLQRAAVHGLAAAQYTLGLNYLDGQLVPPDLAKAVENFRMAADQGGPRSQYTLARLYANGIGNPRDSEDSPFALLLKSAKSNYPPALHALAERYRTGMGVSMDYVQAIRYYKAERQAEEEAPR
ncbi:MAG: sel1 repeat family protein, partial [Pedosphaera sp.]|nr:sel1 repeat family protein [Pedosphaera sp.]